MSKADQFGLELKMVLGLLQLIFGGVVEVNNLEY